MIIQNGKYTDAKIMIDQVEPECISQIISMINHPAFVNPVAIMPDCHSGKGSVIGFTMLSGEKIIPNVIGVDIGCGMLSANIGKVEINFPELDNSIRQKVPFGMNVHQRGIIHMKKDFVWKDGYSYEWFEQTCKKIGIDLTYAINSIGSLGGGNHFIEIGRSDFNEDLWLTIHTGSRNFGYKVCEYWQKVAAGRDGKSRKVLLDAGVEEIKRTAKNGSEIGKRIYDLKKSLQIDKKVTGLEYLEGENVEGYLDDMYFAQQYAKVNREYIMKEILNLLPGFLKKFQIIETIHNYIDPQDKIIRKGSVRSYRGEFFILPFNMRDGLLICEGKSNPEWNFSAPHGAGRLFSRSRAKRELDLNKFKSDMQGIFSTSVGQGTLDECPDAYKDAKIIEVAIEPTAKILDRIIPIHNMKDKMGEE